MFRAILRQEINYFDEPNHSTGVLCTRLSTEASSVQGVTGVRFGTILQHSLSMIVGIIIGMIYSWQLTLLELAFVPLMVFGGIVRIQLTNRFARKNKEILEEAGKVL